MVAVALLSASCADPEVPIAASSGPDALVTVTPTPAGATPTPTVTPTPSPTPELGATPAPTPRPNPQPGLDADSIRIAVVADVETGGTADGIFRDTWTAMNAWALAVNSAGGLGGREVKLVTLDTSLFNHRSVLDVVCRGDYFAIVGGQSLGDYDGAELLGTEDCNLADFPSDVHGARRAASPVTFVPNPILNDVRQSGPVRYLGERFAPGEDDDAESSAQNVAVVWFDELQLRNETERLREMMVGQGLNVVSIDTDLEEGPSERVLTRFEEFEASALVWNADPERLIDLLAAMDDNDIEPSWVLCELACYSQEFLTEGGRVVEGVYTWIPHAPFDALSASSELIEYRFWLSRFSDDAGWSEVGLQAWSAGRLFEEAFNAMLEVEPEAPTREQLIASARTVTSFTADGVLPITNPGGGVPTPCFALMVVRNGRWEQEFPLPPRDLDCSDDNLYELVATRGLGLEDPVATSSINSDQVEDADDTVDLDNPEEPPEE